MNNVRYIRDVYTNEESCEHILPAKGGCAKEYLNGIIQRSRSGCEGQDFTLPVPVPGDTPKGRAFLCSNLSAFLNTSGPAMFDFELFDEFVNGSPVDQMRFSGDFSTKTRNHHTGKHVLLLIGVWKAASTEDGGGYFGLFQNTWEKLPLWVEIGFDLLTSMARLMKPEYKKVTKFFYFICARTELNFDNFCV